MSHPEGRWRAEHSQLFGEHGKTIRGHVRYEVTRHNLKAVLADFLSEPKKVADVGGGTGSDAKWLARVGAGHNVYLFEPDRDSRGKAMESNNRLIQILPGGTEAALEIYGPEVFDLVLSHGVLQYQASPEFELAELVKLLKPGGYLSLLNAGKLGKLNRYQRRGDEAMVDRLLLTGKFYNNLNINAWSFLPQEMEAMIKGAGLETVDWFGVRVLSDDDDRLVDEVPAFHRNRLVDEEIRASRDPALRPSGQMLHYIARKSWL